MLGKRGRNSSLSCPASDRCSVSLDFSIRSISDRESRGRIFNLCRGVQKMVRSNVQRKFGGRIRFNGVDTENDRVRSKLQDFRLGFHYFPDHYPRLTSFSSSRGLSLKKIKRLMHRLNTRLGSCVCLWHSAALNLKKKKKVTGAELAFPGTANKTYRYSCRIDKIWFLISGSVMIKLVWSCLLCLLAKAAAEAIQEGKVYL